MLSRLLRMVKIYGFSYALRYLKYSSLLIYHRFIGTKYLKRKIYDFKMYLITKDIGLSQTLYLYCERELQLKYILEKEIKPGYKIIDLGANLGYYPLIEYQILSGSGKIFAFEPSPINIELLKMNIELNKAGNIIDIYPYAGGEKNGKEKFYLSTHSNVNTMLPTEFTTGKPSRGVSDNFIDVRVIELSSFIKENGNVDLIRMDIEGYEVEVLKGLTKAIEDNSFSGQIVFECHSPKYDDIKHSIRAQLKMLFNNGYYAKYMTSNREKNSPFHIKGYKPKKIIRTSVVNFQGIYENISNEDVEYFICEALGVRDVFFEKRS